MKKYTIYWTAPVRITLGAEPVFVEGPLHAVELLEGDWPETSSEHYLAALRECDLACRLRGGLVSSREFFVAAALAAHVLETSPIQSPVTDAELDGSAPFRFDTSPATKAARIAGSYPL